MNGQQSNMPQHFQSKNTTIFWLKLTETVENMQFRMIHRVWIKKKADILIVGPFLPAWKDILHSAGHRSRQIRQPPPQSKLRQRAPPRFTCFVPMMQKTQNNRDFTLRQFLYLSWRFPSTARFSATAENKNDSAFQLSHFWVRVSYRYSNFLRRLSEMYWVLWMGKRTHWRIILI